MAEMGGQEMRRDEALSEEEWVREWVRLVTARLNVGVSE